MSTSILSGPSLIAPAHRSGGGTEGEEEEDAINEESVFVVNGTVFYRDTSIRDSIPSEEIRENPTLDINRLKLIQQRRHEIEERDRRRMRNQLELASQKCTSIEAEEEETEEESYERRCEDLYNRFYGHQRERTSQKRSTRNEEPEDEEEERPAARQRTGQHDPSEDHPTLTEPEGPSKEEIAAAERREHLEYYQRQKLAAYEANNEPRDLAWSEEWPGKTSNETWVYQLDPIQADLDRLRKKDEPAIPIRCYGCKFEETE